MVNITCIQRPSFACHFANKLVPWENGTIIARFWAKVRPAPNGCVEWTANRTGGRDRRLYGQFTYTVNGEQVHVYAHRFAWQIAHGPIPDGLQILHHCDNGIYVLDGHLFLGTHTDNMQDASAKGRLSKPRTCNRARVAEIRQRWLAGGITQADLAAEYSVHPVQISRWLRAVKERPYERRYVRSAQAVAQQVAS